MTPCWIHLMRRRRRLGQKIIRRRAKFGNAGKGGRGHHAQLTNGEGTAGNFLKAWKEKICRRLLFISWRRTGKKKELRVSLGSASGGFVDSGERTGQQALFLVGQQRTAMLSIKLACAQIAWHSTGERPVTSWTMCFQSWIFPGGNGCCLSLRKIRFLSLQRIFRALKT